jgi:hypothetical protein
LESVVSDDTVRRFFSSIDPVLGAEWINRQVRPLWRALHEQIIMDWDSTVLTKYGQQEGAVSVARGEGCRLEGAWQLAECEVQLTGWTRKGLVVFVRQLQGMVPSEKNGEF